MSFLDCPRVHSSSLPFPSQNLDLDLSLGLNGTPLTPATSSASRAGLFRTPISGGVHSATSAHDLPPPALAVRNLMEQARFAHLSTTMSKMHHRRAGYPFGSLVDFAPDPMGRTSSSPLLSSSFNCNLIKKGPLISY